MTTTNEGTANQGMTNKSDDSPRKRGGGARRMQFTASATQARLLRQAAMATGEPVSKFVAHSSCAAAFQTLVRNLDNPLDDAAWEHFLALLGQPAAEMTRLRALLQSDG